MSEMHPPHIPPAAHNTPDHANDHAADFATEQPAILLETDHILDQVKDTFDQASRLNLDPEEVEKQLLTFVLVLVELIRRLMESQALARMDHGRLTDDQIDRLGDALFRCKSTIEELRDQYNIKDGEFNIDLGPLGKLL